MWETVHAVIYRPHNLHPVCSFVEEGDGAAFGCVRKGDRCTMGSEVPETLHALGPQELAQMRATLVVQTDLSTAEMGHETVQMCRISLHLGGDTMNGSKGVVAGESGNGSKMEIETPHWLFGFHTFGRMRRQVAFTEQLSLSVSRGEACKRGHGRCLVVPLGSLLAPLLEMVSAEGEW